MEHYYYDYMITAYNYQYGFQECMSPIMFAIVSLHNYIMFYIYIIFLFVFWNLFRIYFKYSYIPFKLSYKNVESNFNTMFNRHPIYIFTEISALPKKKIYLYKYINELEEKTNLSIFYLLFNMNVLDYFLFDSAFTSITFEKAYACLFSELYYILYNIFSNKFQLINFLEGIKSYGYDEENDVEDVVDFGLLIPFIETCIICIFMNIFYIRFYIYTLARSYDFYKHLLFAIYKLKIYDKLKDFPILTETHKNFMENIFPYINIFEFPSMYNNTKRFYTIFRFYDHNTLIELIWTVIPILIIVNIALPSFALLYAMDEIINPALTVKVNGYQWYWKYEFGDYIDDPVFQDLWKNSDGRVYIFSNYISKSDLPSGRFYLLEVDNKLVLPIKTHIRFLITAMDVIHSWAIPSLGIKMDAIPGRLNQTSTYILHSGVYYGQCSELCGAYHAFMPIVVKAVTIKEFFEFLYSEAEKINNQI